MIFRYYLFYENLQSFIVLQKKICTKQFIFRKINISIIFLNIRIIDLHFLMWLNQLDDHLQVI